MNGEKVCVSEMTHIVYAYMECSSASDPLLGENISVVCSAATV